MSERSMWVRLPALPSPEFFQEPAHTLRTAGGTALVSYDQVTRSGFVYSIPDGCWSIAAPIDFESFAVLVAAAGHRLEKGGATRRWIQACGGARMRTPLN